MKYSNSSKEVTVLKAKVRKLEEENLNLRGSSNDRSEVEIATEVRGKGHC